MTRLCDLVTIDGTRRSAAIRLDDGLYACAPALVEAFTPTRSSVAILTHLQKAVLQNAPQQSRAMIWHGVYGSGKSHLGVLVGELLRHGIGTSAMQGFLDRLKNQGESRLCDALKTTFHASDDPDARPYLVVPLYGSPAPTLQNALLEGLYRALRDTDGLDPQTIIPKTEFAAALDRLSVILEHEPDYRSKPLSHWQIHSAAFNLEELKTQLDGFVPEALEAFKDWHPKVSAGHRFDPQALGGMGVADAFREAGAALAQNHGYNGIAIIWDEFGYALENLLNQHQRNPVAEIFGLQNFVETACAPSKGHTLFMALTHRSLREYGTITQASDDVKNRLETIEGRFGGFPVALKSSETEGYHLLSAMVAPTEAGAVLLGQARPRAECLAQVCAKMPLFTSLAAELQDIVTGCYPLHPVTAAGLFAIAAHGVYAQANRTVFTFFQNLEAITAGACLERAAKAEALYGAELIRLPELLKVYRKEVFEEYPGLADAYKHAAATVIQGFPEPRLPKYDILGVLLLARVLGEQFQPTDSFLAAALYDAETAPLALMQDLEALHRAGLIWPRETDIRVWELESESGTQIEPLIAEGLAQLQSRTITGYFQYHPDLLQDLLPQCRTHDLDPSPAGIVRSFEVRLLPDDLTDRVAPTPKDERISALILLLMLTDERQADQAIAHCDAMQAPRTMTYVWIPRRGLRDLIEPLRRYIVIAGLLKQQAAGEGLSRRLRNEWDKVRRLLRTEIKERLGRVALERGDVTIKRLGDSDEQVSVTSWHAFTEYLAVGVQALYPKEIMVRTMNVNRLYSPDERKITRIENLLRNILHFDDLPPDLRNDLFGEGVGSEAAALIDGTLGVYSNALLIERGDGWGLKAPDEAVGPVGELLRLIRDTVLDKRRKSCEIADLRATLMAPPFGLPAMVMPVFTAVAIRKDAGRLKWVNRTGAFESLLWDAFSAGTAMKLRFDTFTPKQREVLDALSDLLRLPLSAARDPDERGHGAVSGLRAYYADLPEAVKGSAKLSGAARDLFQVLRKPGLDAQDVANALVDISKGAVDGEQIRAKLRELFDAIASITDERAAAVRQVITTALSERDKKQRITGSLRKQGRLELIEALERVELGAAEALSEVARSMIGKALDQCSDIEVGSLSSNLQRLLEEAATPEPAPLPDPLVPDPERLDGVATPKDTIYSPPVIPGPSTEERFRQELAALIERYQVALDAKQLAALLTGQMETLGSPAAAASHRS